MNTQHPRIFLDSGNPEETKTALTLLGSLDGQTTNPTLVLRNPEVATYVSGGKKLTESELLAIYKRIIGQIEHELPEGHLSVEVNAHWDSSVKDLLTQAHEMMTWGKHVNIKFPTTNAGVKAAHQLVSDGGRVNMTLIFDQIQAAAVYSATMNATDSVFLSPFVGRWDDRGHYGLDLIKNIHMMYESFRATTGKKTHVQILSASLRTLEQVVRSIEFGADILTIPLKTIQSWVDAGKPTQMDSVPSTPLKRIPYEEIALDPSYSSYDIKRVAGSLLDEGLQKFAADWNSILVAPSR